MSKMGGIATPVGGIATPTGIASAGGVKSVEAEGMLTADIIRKPGCVFVALQKAEAFVKHRSSRADFLAKRCFNLLDKFLCLCD